MRNEVQLLVRVTPTLRREIEREKRSSGMTLKAITREAFTEWLKRRKQVAAAAE